MASQNRTLNIVVVGRSGVGKSSFLNYAAGKDVFKTGNGDPVTQGYFDKIDVRIPEKNITYSLFDTKGIEQGNTEEWKKAIYDEIDRRDGSDNIFDWIHTLIYCIDASSRRIQPFEINTINELSKKGSVLVLLTKKDLVTADILEGLRNQLLKEVGDKVQVLSVCSVATRTRKGVSEKSGLENVLSVSFLGLWDKMASILPNRIAYAIATVDLELTVDCDLSDMLAYLALVAWHKSKDGTKIYPTNLIIDAPGIDDYESDNKDIPARAFRKAEEAIEHDIPIKFNKDGVVIIIDHPFWHFMENGIQLDHDQLDRQYYTASVKTYVYLISRIIEKIIDNFRSSQEIFRNIEDSHNGFIAEALNFYKDVNSKEIPTIKHHKTVKAIADINNADFDNFVEDYNNFSSNLISSLKEVEGCVFSSGAERRDAETAFNNYQNLLKDTSNYLFSLLDNFVNSYSTEIHAYGQYCLRKDEFTSSTYEYTDKEQQLIEFIQDLYMDGNISSRDRMLIERKAEKMGIYDRATIDRLIIKATNAH